MAPWTERWSTQEESMNRRGSALVQGHLWSRAAQDWAELQEPTALPLWQAMLAAAAVGPGTRVLDAGCGAGGASVLAARRGAHVNGLDAAEALLAIARGRVPDGDFSRGDLEALPYADGIFDAVIAADVLPYVADPSAALGELRRVCAPGGRLVLAIWGRPQECAQYAIVTALRHIMPTPLGAEPFALSAPGVLDTLVAQAALQVVGGGAVVCPCAYPDMETAWQALVAAGPLQAALRVVGERQLKDVVRAALAPYRTSNGGVYLQNRFRYVTAVPDDGHLTS
jgi:SAM-dependent methyltransferase